MNSEYDIEAPDHVTATDHESEEESGNTPSLGFSRCAKPQWVASSTHRQRLQPDVKGSD